MMNSSRFSFALALVPALALVACGPVDPSGGSGSGSGGNCGPASGSSSSGGNDCPANPSGSTAGEASLCGSVPGAVQDACNAQDCSAGGVAYCCGGAAPYAPCNAPTGVGDCVGWRLDMSSNPTAWCCTPLAM